MSTFKKHVGRIQNTDRRCVVVFMQIPGNEDNALIVDTDALPDRFHDALMRIVDSTEGQQTPNLHQILARRILPDENLDILNALHRYGFLRPVPIDSIIMYPAPNNPCPLRTIVDFMNGEDVSQETETKYQNRHLENQRSENQQAHNDIALNILKQAEDLEASAHKKREEAYRMAPHLRPVVEKQDPPSHAAGVTEASVNVPSLANGDSSISNLDTGLTQPTVEETALETPVAVSQVVSNETAVSTTAESDVALRPSEVIIEDSGDLPPDVLAALKATHSNIETMLVENNDVEGNQVDTSDEALQAFLDRVAFREDLADKEKWLAMQPKNPVGRPRKDGNPVGYKPEQTTPKKRGRPTKAESEAKLKADKKAKARAARKAKAASV